MSETKSEAVLTGGCHCGAIRYQVSAMPFASDYCHCDICKQTTGSVVGAWMDFKVEQVTWLKGKVKEYESSEFVRRGFCEHCGSSLTFRDTRHASYFTLTVTSLDDASKVQPTYHIYTDDQLPWLKIDDNARRYRQGQTKE
ncbi:GFA family protein [Shewanella maritima]|uniref:GFA family protein n=1 Tax=Shewanella maritima TaxID=2520507 RepID=A0A411PL60_9GAMM|nr:GFA family protein [Shewanella maritima]QBF84252.1 GFA family protein [Shewanella maritima]